MCLGVRNRNHVFTIPLDVIRLDIFPGTLVKQVLEIIELVSDGTRQCPHGIPQADRRPLIRCTERYYCLVKRPQSRQEKEKWSYRFMAAKYRYLCIIGTDGWIFSK